MASLMDVFSSSYSYDCNEIFQDHEQGGELYSGCTLYDLLLDGDTPSYRYFDGDEGIMRAYPTASYNPEKDIPFEELGIDEEEKQQILEEDADDSQRLAELEEQCGIWDNEEKFSIETSIQYLGSATDFLVGLASESFSEGDEMTREDIDDLIPSDDNLRIELDDEDYKYIAMEVTSNPLADEDDDDDEDEEEY